MLWRTAIAAILGLLLGALALWLDSTPGAKESWWSLQSWWSLLGYALTYLGATLSGLALYEVTSLSKRFVGRARLPPLRRDLGKETAVLLDKADAQVGDFIANGVLARLAANLRSIKSHRANSTVKTSLHAAMKAVEKLKKEASKTLQQNPPALARESPGFWEAYYGLEELKVDMDNYQQDEKKRQYVQ